MNNIKQIGLYVHIPFCRAKCHYCDFNSFCGSDQLIPQYFDALQIELEAYAEELAGYSIKSIFIGGGTPSHVDSDYIYGIMDLCRRSFNIIENAEISIETNPGTLNADKLAAYRASGINRLSIGLQAWQERLLKFLGRIHSSGEFVRNFKLAEKAGFDNINTDLIFGIPGQTLEEWKETLENILALKPAHLSCYSLKIEEDTVLGNKYEKGELIPIEEETDREMYELTCRILRDHGYNHYEISNFALPGYECRHNLIYWKAEEYIGVGAGAHSYIHGKRFCNTGEIEEYISKINSEGFARQEMEVITKEDSMSEYMILGLRLISGVSAYEFSERYGEDVYKIYGKQITELENSSLLEIRGDRIFLSRQGLDLANQVFMEFI